MSSRLTFVRIFLSSLALQLCQMKSIDLAKLHGGTTAQKMVFPGSKKGLLPFLAPREPTFKDSIVIATEYINLNKSLPQSLENSTQTLSNSAQTNSTLTTFDSSLTTLSTSESVKPIETSNQKLTSTAIETEEDDDSVDTSKKVGTNERQTSNKVLSTINPIFEMDLRKDVSTLISQRLKEIKRFRIPRYMRSEMFEFISDDILRELLQKRREILSSRRSNKRKILDK